MSLHIDVVSIVPHRAPGSCFLHPCCALISTCLRRENDDFWTVCLRLKLSIGTFGTASILSSMNHCPVYDRIPDTVVLSIYFSFFK